MMAELFESAATNTALMQEIASAIAGVAASGLVRLADQDPDFKASVAAALDGVAREHGLSFTPQAPASPEAAQQVMAGAIAKFKQHKDNPTQIPIGTPIALLFIGAALLFLPTILQIAGGTIFGDGGVPGIDGREPLT